MTAANAGGSGSADSNLVGPVVPQAPPTVVTAPSLSGDAIVGSTLTADPGSWSDPAATFTYAWQRCDGSGNCTTIDGADDTTYVLTADDVGFPIEVTVTAANPGGSGSADSNLVGPVVPQAPPTVVTAPSLSGDAIVGSTLTADPGTWSDPAATFTYAWQRCDGNSGNCTHDRRSRRHDYVLTSGRRRLPPSGQVTAANAGGSGSADSSLVGPVVPQAPPTDRHRTLDER